MAAALAVLALLVVPGPADGVTYLVAGGTSMTPLISRGDLVLTRPQESYAVGEVVAYHSATLRTVVLHRIVAVTGDSYTMRGDANHWVDPDHPTSADVLGRMWLHVPGVGAIVQARATIPPDIVVAVVLALVFGSGLFTRNGSARGPRPSVPARRARRGSRARPRTALRAATQATRRTSARTGHTTSPFASWLSTAAIATAAVGVVAFALPTQEHSTRQVPYTQTLTLGYRATATPGVVYPDGVVQWGQPVYPRLVQALQIWATHTVTGPLTGAVSGTLTLTPRLESATGWRDPFTAPTTVPLDQTTRADVRIDLSGIAARSAAVEKASGASLGSVSLIVDASADLTTSIDGQPVHSTFARPLTLRIDGAQLVLIPTDPAATQPGTVTVPTVRPRRVSVVGIAVPILWLRWTAACAAGVIAALAAGWLLLRRRDRTTGDEPAPQYPDRVVRVVGEVGVVGGVGGLVDVATMADLMRLADQVGEPVLVHGARGSEEFVVEYASSRYRFRPDRAGSARQVSVPLPRSSSWWEADDPRPEDGGADGAGGGGGRPHSSPRAFEASP